MTKQPENNTPADELTTLADKLYNLSLDKWSRRFGVGAIKKEVLDFLNANSYVQLDENQSLPKLARGEDSALYSFKEGQQSLVRNNWRKVKKEITNV